MKFTALQQGFNEFLSPPAREVWIEIPAPVSRPSAIKSPPAREVWIEIPAGLNATGEADMVASRAGGVD